MYIFINLNQFFQEQDHHVLASGPKSDKTMHSNSLTKPLFKLPSMTSYFIKLTQNVVT